MVSSPVKHKAPVFHIKKQSITNDDRTSKAQSQGAQNGGNGDTSPVSDLLCMSDIPDAQKYSDSAGKL